MKHQKLRLTALALSLVSVIIVTSCGNGEDPDPVFGAPSLSLEGASGATLKPGDAITVTLNIEAEGGLSAIIVNRNGGFLEEIELADPAATTFTYTGQTVAEDASEGEAIAYEFVGVNTQDLESDPVAFDVSVALYDLVTNSAVGDVYQVAVPADFNIPSGTTVKLAAGRSYYLPNSVNFEDGSAFEIEEGVTVYLNADSEEPVFVEIQAAASLSISGTATAPVVMTSSRAMTGDTPEPGDWDTFELEGTAGSVIRYLRIEYAVEGFRVDGCDNSNDVAYVTVYKSDGEGFYITGGNFNGKYFVAIDNGDSNFRLGDDYTGNLQFLVVHNEIDGGEAFYLRENSDITLANVTVVGPGAATADEGFGNAGVRFRSTTGGKMYNAVVTGMPDWGVRAQEAVPTDINGPVVFAYSHVYGNDSRDDDDAEIFFTEASFMNSEDPIAGIAEGSFVPSAETTSEFDPSTLGSFFTAAPFVGAIQNAANDWTVGWVKNVDGTIR